MSILQVGEDSIKKVEALFLSAALIFLPLGVEITREAAQAANTTSFLMGMCMVVVGLVCGGIYIWVEKAAPKVVKVKKEDEEE